MPDYIQLNAQAEIAAENVQRQVNEQIQAMPALKEVLTRNAQVDYHLGRLAVDNATHAIGRPVCNVLGNTVGTGLGGASGAVVGALFPPVELPAILIGAQAGRVATEYTCNLTVRALGRTAWGKAYQARADERLVQAKSELSSQYDRIHTQALAQLINGKDASTSAYLQDQYYRSIKQQPFYGLLNDEKKNAIDQERTRHRATLTAQNASFQAMATQHDAIDVATEKYINRISEIMAAPQTNSPPPSTKMIAENKAFLKEFKAENAALNNQTQRQLNAVLHEQKIYNQELKKLNAHNDQQLKKENALAQYKGMEAGFNVISQLGAISGNETLGKIGSIGASGVSIAGNAAMLTGAIPGVALAGWGLMVPYAGIFLAGLSIITTLFGKKKKNDDSLMKALQALSNQIEAVRREMHQRFDRLEGQMRDMHQDIDNKLQLLHNVLLTALTDGFDGIQFKLEHIQEDLNRLGSLLTRGLEANYLKEFITAISAIDQYVNMTDNNNAEIKKKLVTLTTWLTDSVFLKNTNAAWTLPEGLTAANVFSSENLRNHEKLLGNELSTRLGYLAKLASLITGTDFNGVHIESLPNIALFTQGVDAYVQGRLHMGPQAAKMDPHNHSINKIQAIAENGLQFMQKLITNEQTILRVLFERYYATYHQLIGTVATSARTRLNTGTVPGFEFPAQDPLVLNNINWPTTISCSGANYDALPIMRVLSSLGNMAAPKIPRFIQMASKNRVGNVKVYYTPTYTAATRGGHYLGDHAQHHWIVGRTADYNIQIKYEIGDFSHVLYSLTARYREPDTQKEYFRNKPKNGGQALKESWYDRDAAAKNALSKNDFFKNNWAKATLSAVTDNSAANIPANLIQAVSDQIVARSVFQSPFAPSAIDAILARDVLAHPELLNNLPQDLGILKSLLRRFALLTNSPALPYINLLFDKARFLAEPTNRPAQTAAPSCLQGAIARPIAAAPRVIHPIVNHLQYCSQILEAVKQLETILTDQAIEEVAQELQVDQAIVFDPNRVQCELARANRIGVGSFGQVYRGRDTQSNRDIAVKVLFPGAELSEAAQGELDVAARLQQADHPSARLVEILGVTTIQGQNAIVMEYVDNGNLEQHLHKREQRLDCQHAAPIAQQIIQGIAFLHSCGITHGDVKSANILLTMLFQVKIADYGLSQVAANTQRATTRSRNTEVHVGTLAYRAPEMIRNSRLRQTQQSDIYAMGVVLWEMLTRNMPFHETDGSDAAILTGIFAFLNHMEDAEDPFAIPDATAVTRGFHTQYAPIIRECMASAPAARPTAAALNQRL